jgi:hypothetical protein
MASIKFTIILAVLTVLAVSGLVHAKRDPTTLPGPAAVAVTRPTCDQLKATTNSALTKVIWPASANIAFSGNPSAEFSVDVEGRIVPVGNFEVSMQGP